MSNPFCCLVVEDSAEEEADSAEEGEEEAESEEEKEEEKEEEEGQEAVVVEEEEDGFTTVTRQNPQPVPPRQNILLPTFDDVPHATAWGQKEQEYQEQENKRLREFKNMPFGSISRVVENVGIEDEKGSCSPPSLATFANCMPGREQGSEEKLTR